MAIVELGLCAKRVGKCMGQGVTIHTIKWWIDTICVFEACLYGEEELSLHSDMNPNGLKKKMR